MAHMEQLPVDEIIEGIRSTRNRTDTRTDKQIKDDSFLNRGCFNEDVTDDMDDYYNELIK